MTLKQRLIRLSPDLMEAKSAALSLKTIYDIFVFYFNDLRLGKQGFSL
jgi:hypothetical protein